MPPTSFRPPPPRRALFGLPGYGSPLRLPDFAPSDFSPDQIPGLELWLKADALTGLLDGDPVTTWEDSSPANNDAASAGSARPTYKTNIKSGLPVVRFDGIGNFMSVAGITANDASRTVFAVQKRNATSGGQRFWGFTDTASLFDAESFGAGRYGYFCNEGFSTVDLGGNTDAFQVVAIRWNGTSSADGFVNEGSATNFDPSDSYQTGGALLHLGANSAGANFGSCDLAEIVSFDSRLGDSDVARMRTYLIAKWALLALPVEVASAPAGFTAAAAPSVAQTAAAVAGGDTTFAALAPTPKAASSTTAGQCTFAGPTPGAQGSLAPVAGQVTFAALAPAAKASSATTAGQTSFAGGVSTVTGQLASSAGQVTFGAAGAAVGWSYPTVPAGATFVGGQASVAGAGPVGAGQCTFAGGTATAKTSAASLAGGCTFAAASPVARGTSTATAGQATFAGPAPAPRVTIGPGSGNTVWSAADAQLIFSGPVVVSPDAGSVTFGSGAHAQKGTVGPSAGPVSFSATTPGVSFTLTATAGGTVWAGGLAVASATASATAGAVVFSGAPATVIGGLPAPDLIRPLFALRLDGWGAASRLESSDAARLEFAGRGVRLDGDTGADRLDSDTADPA